MIQTVFFSFCHRDIIPSHSKHKNAMGEKSEVEFDSQAKSLIDEGLKNTVTTVVIMSPKSYSSRHMRYEIIKSIELGKEVLGLRISHNIINPFSQLAIRYNAQGTGVEVFEMTGKVWKRYKDLENYDVHDVSKEFWGKFFILSELYVF